MPGRAGHGQAELAARLRRAVGHRLGAGRDGGQHGGLRQGGRAVLPLARGALVRLGGPPLVRDHLGLLGGQALCRGWVERRRPRLPRRRAGGHALAVCLADPAGVTLSLKQDPHWQVEQLENGDVRWTTPSGRQYVTEPTRYPCQSKEEVNTLGQPRS